MDRKGSGDVLEASGSKTPEDTSESGAGPERSANDLIELRQMNQSTASESEGTASPSKSACSSTSTSAENLAGMEMKVEQ